MGPLHRLFAVETAALFRGVNFIVGGGVAVGAGVGTAALSLHADRAPDLALHRPVYALRFEQVEIRVRQGVQVQRGPHGIAVNFTPLLEPEVLDIRGRQTPAKPPAELQHRLFPFPAADVIDRLFPENFLGAVRRENSAKNDLRAFREGLNHPQADGVGVFNDRDSDQVRFEILHLLLEVGLHVSFESADLSPFLFILHRPEGRVVERIIGRHRVLIEGAVEEVHREPLPFQDGRQQGDPAGHQGAHLDVGVEEKDPEIVWIASVSFWYLIDGQHSASLPQFAQFK